MLNAYLLFIFQFSLCCVWPHHLGDPVYQSYLPSQGKHISGWLTDWEGNCQPPPGQDVLQLGTLPARDGRSLSDSWNAARQGAVPGQRSPLAPLLGTTLQKAFSASHGTAGSTIAPTFPRSERGPLSHSSAAHRQHSWASLSSNIPQLKWQREPEEVPMAIGQGCRKEQPAKPPPWWGKWCLQHSLLSVQSEAAGAGVLEKSPNIRSKLFPRGCLLPPRWQRWLTVETLLPLWGQSQLSKTLTAI